MAVTRREMYLDEVKTQLEMLKDEDNEYGFHVPTVEMDAEMFEYLDERDRLPAIHIMQGARGTKHMPGQGEGRSATLSEVTEVFPILIRGTVKGFDPKTDSDSDKEIPTKSIQAVRLHYAIESVLDRGTFEGLPGVYQSFLEEFSHPGVRERWGSPHAILEFNFYILHTYSGEGSI